MLTRIAIALPAVLAVGLLACSPGESVDDETAQIPDALLGYRLVVTIESSETPALLTPGSEIVYQFVDDNRVLGSGPDTVLPTKAWTFTRTGSSSGSLLLDYGQAGTESYDLRADSQLRGACDMHVHQTVVGADDRDLYADCSFVLSEGVDE